MSRIVRLASCLTWVVLSASIVNAQTAPIREIPSKLAGLIPVVPPDRNSTPLANPRTAEPSVATSIPVNEVASEPLQPEKSVEQTDPDPPRTPSKGHGCGQSGECAVELESIPKFSLGYEEPIDIPVGFEPSKVFESESFYRKCVEFEARIPTPHIVERAIEQRKFPCGHAGACRCEGPIRDVVVSSVTARSCEFLIRTVRLRACVRSRTGKVDVYALAVPGMPAEWVIMLEEAPNAVSQRFGIRLD